MMNPDLHLVLREESAEAERLRALLDEIEAFVIAHSGRGEQENAPAGGDGRVVLDLASEDLAARLRTLHLECGKGQDRRCFTIRSGAIGELIDLADPSSPAPAAASGRRLADKSESVAPTAPPPEPSEAFKAGLKTAETLITKILGPKLHLGPGFMDHFNATAEAISEAIAADGIGAWLRASRGYESRTFRHVLLVSGYSAAFAQMLRFGQRDRHRLVVAALLHDIGKSDIPARVRDKQGRLDQAEMALMRTHPQRGYQKLVDTPDLDPKILDVVLHHHEFLDGSGYPERLKGRQIGDLVRLMTIAGTFCTLMEVRGGQEAMSPGDALQRMRDMDTKLDPVLVQAFSPVALASAT